MTSLPLKRWGLALLLVALGCRLSGQSAVEALIARMHQTSNSHEIRSILSQVWQADSTQVYRVAMDAMAAMERPDGKMPRLQADTLLRMVRIGQENDPHGPASWMVARALLGIRQEQHYGAWTMPWAMECIQKAPSQVPIVLVREASKRLVNEVGGSWASAAEHWSMIERLLARRALDPGQEGADWAREQTRLTLRVRAACPDCGQLLALYADPIAKGELAGGECRTFLVLYALQGCDQAGLWEAAWNRAAGVEDSPWLQRMAATEAMNRADWEVARGHWVAAMAGEVDSVLKAADMLAIAATWRGQGKLREAKLALQNAMLLKKDWGEPYLALMDLYVAGAEECTWPDFEARAMYWLLMDLCQRMKTAAPDMAAKADARFRIYARRAPSLREAAFLGWQPGDTYPIKCWMNTATVVPQLGL